MKKVLQFPIRNTNVYSGQGAVELLPQLLKDLGGKRAIIYTDKGIKNAGIEDKVVDLFKDAEGVEIVGIFEDIEQDAVGSIINAGAKFFKENGADSIIALGGGSVLDTTKAIKWMLNKNINDIYEAFIHGKKLEKWPEAQPINIPHIAIGTTAGPGCEVSSTSVVYHEEKGIKISLMSPFIGPNIAIADPELTLSLPKSLTAYTGFDAFTHAIEAFFSYNANPVSDAYAKQAISMINENIAKAVNEGNDIDARNNMLLANILAIAAFGFAVGNLPIHNVAHTLGAKRRVPHGLANAVLITKVMEQLPDVYKPRIKEFAKLIGLKNEDMSQNQCFDETIDYLRKLSLICEIPEKLDLDINENNIQQLVEDVHNDPVGVNYKIPGEAVEKILLSVTK